MYVVITRIHMHLLDVFAPSLWGRPSAGASRSFSADGGGQALVPVPSAGADRQEAEDPPGGLEWVWVGLCMAIGTAFRALNPTGRPLWADEIITLITVRRPFWESLGHVQDTQPPIFQMMVRALADGPNPSEWVMRWPSVVCGSLAVLAGWWFARTLFGAGVAAMAVLLVAVNPMLVHYSQEARPYAVFTLFSLLSMAQFYRMLRYGGAWNTLTYVVASVLMLNSHYYAFLCFAAQIAYAAMDCVINRWHRGQVGRVGAAFFVVGLGSLGTFYFVVRQLTTGLTRSWIPGARLLDSYEFLSEMVGLGLLGALCLIPFIAAWWPGRTAFDQAGDGAPQDRPETGLQTWWARRERVLLCAVWIALVFFVPILISQTLKPVFVLRYALPIIVPVLLLGIVYLSAANRVVLAMVLLLVLLDNSVDSYRQVVSPASGMRQLVQWVHKNTDQSAPLLVADYPWCEGYVSSELVGLQYYGIGDRDVSLVTVKSLEKKPGDEGAAVLPAERCYFVCFMGTSNPLRDRLRTAGRVYRELEFGKLFLFVLEPQGLSVSRSLGVVNTVL